MRTRTWPGPGSGTGTSSTRMSSGFEVNECRRADRMCPGVPESLHRMQAEHVAVRIERQRDEPVLADRHLGALDLAARGDDARLLHAAVFAAEVDERAVA